ncbi:hypothetical protein SUGI_0942800 [Cryptomeria japonica]|nr:hypothetical protein SUGI_0942800 [Cryptomeria japonica]
MFTSSNEKQVNSLPDNKHVVLYYTSSKVIPQTYADCCTVISILETLNISFQQRDVFLGRKYLEEIKDLLGKEVSLPQLFVRGKHVGGYQRILELNQSGKLKKMLNCYRSGNLRELCKGCGNLRHIVCFVCSGSKRFYRDDIDEIARCNICNENGLLPCHVCLMGAVNPKNQRNSFGRVWRWSI